MDYFYLNMDFENNNKHNVGGILYYYTPITGCWQNQQFMRRSYTFVRWREVWLEFELGPSPRDKFSL